MSKSNWIKENEPEIWKKALISFVTLGYLNYKLTGNLVDSVACQIGHLPLTIKKNIGQNHIKYRGFKVFKRKATSAYRSGRNNWEILQKLLRIQD